MSEINLFNQVKNLFCASDEAIHIYMTLKNCMLSKTGDELYIFESKEDAERQFWKAIANTREITYNTEKLYLNFYKENYRVYYKTINELKRTLDGYRFKRIDFIEKSEK